jgi:hypothetical protein
MPRALKVYRTAIGFHDAYVAAPTMKAALAAWGTDKNLFARKAAELVEDPKLTAEPLAHPGEVIRVLRGSASEHVKALGKIAPARKSAPARDKPVPPPPPAKPKRPPKPTDEAVRLACDAARIAEQRAKERLAELAAREKALAAERVRLERELAGEARRHRDRVERAERDYAEALEAWRAA